MTVSIYSRYYGLGIIEHDGKVTIAHRPVAMPETYPDSLVHVLVGGETPEQLAARYYGREDLWWRIGDANPGRFPLDWKPGDELVIPPVRIATRVPRR